MKQFLLALLGLFSPIVNSFRTGFTTFDKIPYLLFIVAMFFVIIAVSLKLLVWSAVSIHGDISPLLDFLNAKLNHLIHLTNWLDEAVPDKATLHQELPNPVAGAS